MTHLTIDADGTVCLVEPETEESDGRSTVLGHVLDDWRCPEGMQAEWETLASRWMEETEDGQAERDLWRQEFEASLSGAFQ